MKTVNAYKIRVVLAVCILIVFAGISWAEGPVYFADQNLKAAVEEELGITDPNETDMLDLTSLDASNRGIVDLTGLEYATNLTWLQLYNNQISDISPISALKKLEVLSLVGNQISDCCDLANLLTLTRLGLSDNQISDISCLSGLTELTGLFLYSNDIVDISPLSGLAKLIDLFIDWNRISDISPLNGLTELSGLHLADNEISDISPLANLEKLEYLVLWGNHISDINEVSGLTNLRDLALGDNQISNISVLSGLTNLRGLGLYRNQITDICALSGLTNLEGLGLSGNQICDINCLSELTKLTDLELGNNCISDISVLSGLINLRELWLYNNQISDCNVLSGLINLERLGLWTNQISDIAALAEMTKLTLLDLTVNPLNRDAYCVYLPIIIDNNPNLTDLRYDPNPYSCTVDELLQTPHFFDDFNDYNHDPITGLPTQDAGSLLQERGWRLREGTGGPSHGLATWERKNVRFSKGSGDAHGLIHLLTITNGTPLHTVQSQINTELPPDSRFFAGTYAARVRFCDYDRPRDYNDGTVQTFYAISNVDRTCDTNDYSECDFEYLAYDAWSHHKPVNEPPGLHMATWELAWCEPENHGGDLGDRTKACRPGSLADADKIEWHTLLFTVASGQVKYYLDQDTQPLAIHGGKYYPESLMSINFNHWIDPFAYGEITPDWRTYDFQVDWVVHLKNLVVNVSDVNAIVQHYRTQDPPVSYVGSIRLTAYSPVQISITDPFGRTTDITEAGIPWSQYIVEDLNGDGDADHTVMLYQPIDGPYLINITPLPGAEPNETYSLYVDTWFNHIPLAENSPITDIPPQGFSTTLSGSRIRYDYCVFESPIINTDFALKDGTTVPIKFHIMDCEGTIITEQRNVSLEVTGPNAIGEDVTYIFSRADGSLRFDAEVWPPHYIANFSTREYSVLDGGDYVATVKENGAPIGSTGFMVNSAAGTGRSNRQP